MNARQLHPGLFTALWVLPLVALLQVSVVQHVSLRGVLPSIMLILIVDWGILRGTDEGMLWALLGGVIIDSMSGWPFGTSTVALVTVAWAVSLGEGTFIRTHALLPMATVFGATVLYFLVAFFILLSTQHSIDWLAAMRDTVLPAAIYNAVLNIPGFWLVQRLEHRVYPTPRANW